MGAELNQEYTRNSFQLIGGVPSWWSADGRYFLYFVKEHQHWKINAVRHAGGDGVHAVEPTGRKAGCGFAHSGIAGSCCDDPTEALCDHGWFECRSYEWEAAPQIVARLTESQEFLFVADAVELEETHVHGSERSQERHTASCANFRGWRRLGDPRGEIRILLPPVP